jgi:hypothetical protein
MPLFRIVIPAAEVAADRSRSRRFMGEFLPYILLDIQVAWRQVVRTRITITSLFALSMA